MLTKLFANILGSILKSGNIITNFKDRDFNIKTILFIIILSLWLLFTVFLLTRVTILSKRIVSHRDTHANIPCSNIDVDKK